MGSTRPPPGSGLTRGQWREAHRIGATGAVMAALHVDKHTTSSKMTGAALLNAHVGVFIALVTFVQQHTKTEADAFDVVAAMLGMMLTEVEENCGVKWKLVLMRVDEPEEGGADATPRR